MGARIDAVNITDLAGTNDLAKMLHIRVKRLLWSPSETVWP